MFRFADFIVDVRTRRLLKGEQEMHLSPKAFDLLTMLLENRAQAMSKADLQQKLWPSTYVLETNLAGVIAEIRHALDDSADTPRYIRTIHRFGYWFVADKPGSVTVSWSKAAGIAPGRAESRPAATRRRSVPRRCRGLSRGRRRRRPSGCSHG